MMISFARPSWLFALPAFVLLGVVLFRHADRKRRLALQSFASAHLLEELTANVSTPRRRVKRALFSAGVLLVLVALARPQWGFRWEEAKRKGIDLLVVVDTSKSMLAEDVKPSRLVRAKLAVTDLLDKLEGDRVGLIAFAGSAFLQCPLTLDYDAFRQSLDALDVNVIPRGGTDIASAIHEAEKTFQIANPNHKILVLITDGEDLQASGVEAARAAAKNGVRIFALGVGTTNGELIPVPQENGGIDFLKDASGQPVKSRLDEATLREIAEATGGFYAPLGQQNEGLAAIYEQGIGSIPKQDLFSRMNRVPIERFGWPLGMALFCLIAEYLLSDRKQAWLGGRALRPAKAVSFVALIFWMSCLSSLWANPFSRGEGAYQRQEYDKALQEFKKAAEKHSSPQRQFNLGAAAFKTSQFSEAERAFEQALKTDRTELQENAFYNLGNTHYRIGEQTEKTDKPKAIQQWQTAVQSYEHALALKSNDDDARFNLEFVKKKLEELQKQQASDSSKKQEPKNSQEKEKNENQKPPPESSKPQNGGDQKDAQNPSGSQEKKKETPQKDSKPGSESKPSSSEPERNAQAQKGSSEKKDPGEPVPVKLGEMSREDAERLLDSQRSEEKKYPVVIPEKREEPPAKDW